MQYSKALAGLRALLEEKSSVRLELEYEKLLHLVWKTFPPEGASIWKPLVQYQIQRCENRIRNLDKVLELLKEYEARGAEDPHLEHA